MTELCAGNVLGPNLWYVRWYSAQSLGADLHHSEIWEVVNMHSEVCLRPNMLIPLLM
jgi:hypothetical protein